jgi:hypothetical protein
LALEGQLSFFFFYIRRTFVTTIKEDFLFSWCPCMGDLRWSGHLEASYGLVRRTVNYSSSSIIFSAWNLSFFFWSVCLLFFKKISAHIELHAAASFSFLFSQCFFFRSFFLHSVCYILQSQNSSPFWVVTNMNSIHILSSSGDGRKSWSIKPCRAPNGSGRSDPPDGFTSF